MQEAVADLRQDNLNLHEVEIKHDGGQSLGCILDGQRQETRPTDKRFAMIRKGIRRSLRMRKLMGLQLEVIVGHCTLFGLLSREVLSFSSLSTALSTGTMANAQTFGLQCNKSSGPSLG